MPNEQPNGQQAPAEGTPNQQQQLPDGPQKAGESEVDYWKRVANEHREKARSYDEYGTLIRHMNDHPEHVDAFERIVRGQVEDIAVAEGMARQALTAHNSRGRSEEDALLAELGLDGSTSRSPAPQADPQQRQLTVQEAERMGAMRERVRIELAQFRDDVTRAGIGDHIVDEFIEYLRNPNGMTYHDLFAGWRAGKVRMTGNDPLAAAAENKNAQAGGGPKPGVMPSTIASMTSATPNRPNAGVYPAKESSERYVSDPSSI